MWLPRLELGREEQLAEFDEWVTPSIGDVRDADQFLNARAVLYHALVRFSEELLLSGSTLVACREVVAAAIESDDVEHCRAELEALISLLYVVTAKSDNAVKCQYPIWYRRSISKSYPFVSRGKVSQRPVPSVIKSNDLVGNVVALSNTQPALAGALATNYTEFVLRETRDRRQLEALARAFSEARTASDDRAAALLSPLVAYQIRGSVAATGGHDPEALAREFLVQWGLTAVEDFNLNDLTARAIAVADGADIAVQTSKSRAFDLVVPVTRREGVRRTFVQSQFYAGDSGSVSHKNVDQAAGSRKVASALFPDAVFVELVDGAGYCGSLRGDLSHLLFADDTYDWTQLRSLPIRLRRVLQEAGVILPIDLAVRVDEDGLNRAQLQAEIEGRIGSPLVASRAIESSIEGNWLHDTSGVLSIHADRLATVKRYAFLDCIVANARRSPGAGSALIPGFGPDFGSPIKDSWDRNLLEALVEEGTVMLA